MPRFRSIPVDVDAEQWTGANADAVNVVARGDFNALDESDRANCDDPDATGQLFERRDFGPASAWRLVYHGDWIVRENGTLYVCRAEAFAAQFEQVAE